jgi:NAD(P)-dependent dehydrogenase (short-subunit alcohol dehydrogenase family)
MSSNIAITGASAGLGRLLADTLRNEGHRVLSFDIASSGNFQPEIRCDVSDAASVAEATAGVTDVDVLVNCAGVNGIDYLEDTEESKWDQVMDVNAKGIYLMTKALLPALIQSKGTVVNIVSNASHMPMTSSIAYNASKGAAHIMTLQLARELTRRHGVTVFGISPNKLRGTEMSKHIEAEVVRVRGWTPEFAEQYQRNALLAGEETDPATLAEFIAYLLQSKQHHKYLTGCVIPYGA